MPAKSARQQRFFGYLKSHPLEAAKRGISPKVVDEFAVGPVPSVKPKKGKLPKAPNLKFHFGSMAPE